MLFTSKIFEYETFFFLPCYNLSPVWHFPFVSFVRISVNQKSITMSVELFPLSLS